MPRSIRLQGGCGSPAASSLGPAVCLLPFSHIILALTVRPIDDRAHFLQLATELAGLLRHSIFVDQVCCRSYFHPGTWTDRLSSQVHHVTESRSEILALLHEHITANIVKIDNQYYRQCVGIPQGSAISTLLCSFFYGSLEMEKLQFMSQPGNVSELPHKGLSKLTRLCRSCSDMSTTTASSQQT